MPQVTEYVEKTANVHNADIHNANVPENNAANELQRLHDVLVEQLGLQRFNLWFGQESSIHFEENGIVFNVKNHFAIDWIRSNFQQVIEQSVITAFGKTLPVNFSVVSAEQAQAQNLDNPPKPAAVKPSIPRPHCPLQIPDAVRQNIDVARQNQKNNIPRRFATLNTFIEGFSNRLAYRAATLAVEHSGQINPIYIYGTTSVGKTHLLEGIWSAVRQQARRDPPLYMTSEQFISSFLENIQPGSSRNRMQTFRNKFLGISILLMDDIQYLSRKDATQTEFLHTIDTLRNLGTQMVFTGNRPLKELTGLRNEIICRLESGMVCGIELPEREMALRIFQNMVAQRQLPIGQDVCRMVTSRFGIHARQLSGALNRLHAVYLTRNEPITLEIAEETLSDLIRIQRRDVRLQDIEKVVCETFGLSEQSLQSKSRAKQIAAPRMLAMWLARKYTRSALSEIGKYFGDRSHSTVVTAQKKVDQWVDKKHPIHSELLNIAEMIQKIEQILSLQSG
ncbi:MAG: chromosomal replication initiator protein DnaA [Planctomycetaceae bacterium]|jgi:chromosomal replication initiator protein|nr:chromosomal replication initiator protein DnaA [Planctomycetaceae bacterium]